MISPDFIDQLLSRIDIVELIDRYVPLKKSGQNFIARCPFHKEKTASFSVNQSKQFYHCFGCGAHGSAIGFVMEYQAIGFVDALQVLASGVGMSVPENSQVDSGVRQQQLKHRSTLEQLMQEAAKFYKQQLKNTSFASDYLKQRGLTGKIAATFALGYAPEERRALSQVVDDYDDERLVESGLVIEADEKYPRRDRFRGRIIFPITNQRGAIVGFGGRIIGKGEPKYLNSPQTALFEKSQELYGLYEARHAIRAQNSVLVVEGYMDVVALAQNGIEYVVATLGTATTADHIKKLLRHADKIYFCFDGDLAGRKAAWRALENSLPMLQDGKTISFLFLPEQHDPDSFVREHGAQEFERCLQKESLPLSGYFIQQLSAQEDMNTSEGRANLLRKASPLLQKISAAPTLAFLLRQRLAELTGIDINNLERLLGRENVNKYKGYREYALPEESHRPKIISLVRQQIMWLLLNPAWAIDVALPDSIPLTGELGCLSMLAEIVLQYETAPVCAQLLENIRGTAYEMLINDIMQNSYVSSDMLDKPGDEARLSFQQGNQKLLNMLAAEQLANLIKKLQHESLNSAEKHLLLQLLANNQYKS